MKVYVIRWEKCVDGVSEGGCFEVCHTDEAMAEKSMLQDMKETMKEWQEDGNTPVTTIISPKNENGCSDYCYIMNDRYDRHEWFIDSLVVD